MAGMKEGEGGIRVVQPSPLRPPSRRMEAGGAQVALGLTLLRAVNMGRPERLPETASRTGEREGRWEGGRKGRR